MKSNSFYIKPMISEETIDCSQIIASSPSAEETPKIDGGSSEGGSGLVDNRESWGDLW